MKVLVAEDDLNIRNGLIEVLEREGYQCIAAADGEEALTLYRAEQPDFLCLDIMMPKRNGYDLCREIRKENETVPIIFISAKSEEVDRVLGLELGADDYIMKPFGVREVVARIRAVTRRSLAARPPEKQPAHFSIADWKVHPAELRAKRGDTVLDLSLREVKLLQAFAEHPGEVLDRNTLLDLCWGREYYPNSRTLDQHIAQLRKHIEADPANPTIIQTIYGTGYRYDPQ